jgi:uncharacterized membrane protein
MTRCAHLWAVAFDGTEQAAQVGDAIVKLGGEPHDFIVRDVAVAVRWPDGCCTLNGAPLPDAPHIGRGGLASFLAALALGAPPLTGPAAGVLLESVGCVPDDAGISIEFIREVERLMRPGTSVLFVFDEVGEVKDILPGLHGLGGTVLKSNVDPERARLIQSALSVSAGACPAKAQ